MRNEWTPKAEARQWKYIVMHHTAASRGNVESIDRAHRERGWQGIGYHFLIGNGDGMGDGAVEPTFRWRTQIHGAHAGKAEFNERGIGICLVGNFEETKPTDAQRDSLIQLVQSLAREYGITEDRVIVHSDVKATKCPGKFFPVNEVLRSVREVAEIQGGPRPFGSNNLAMAQPLRFDSRSAVTGRVTR